MRNYRSLQVWQRAHTTVGLVYRLTDRFPTEERFGLVSQMRRAAVSVASNIAEAAGRSSDPDAARFLSIAAGSASELQYQLELAIELGYSDVDAKQALDLSHEVKRMLRSLIRSWAPK
jgi:four helix bundle protein